MNIQKLAFAAIKQQAAFSSTDKVTIFEGVTKKVFIARNSQDQIVCYVVSTGKVLKPTWVVANWLGYWSLNESESEYTRFVKEAKASIAGQMRLF